MITIPWFLCSRFKIKTKPSAWLLRKRGERSAPTGATTTAGVHLRPTRKRRFDFDKMPSIVPRRDALGLSRTLVILSNPAYLPPSLLELILPCRIFVVFVLSSRDALAVSRVRQTLKNFNQN